MLACLSRTLRTSRGARRKQRWFQIRSMNDPECVCHPSELSGKSQRTDASRRSYSNMAVTLGGYLCKKRFETYQHPSICKCIHVLQPLRGHSKIRMLNGANAVCNIHHSPFTIQDSPTPFNNSTRYTDNKLARASLTTTQVLNRSQSTSEPSCFDPGLRFRFERSILRADVEC